MASKFWVGGTGNWDASTTTHWSTSSGGSGGAAVPSTSDAVTFDSNSGSPTVTITATANCSSLTSTAAAVTLSAGSNTINVAGNGATAWVWTAGTFTAGTSTIVLSGTGSSLSQLTFSGGGKTYYNLTFSSTFGMVNVAGTNTFNNLAFSASSAGLYLVQLANSQTISGTLTANGFDAARTLFLRSGTVGTQITLTVGTLSTNGYAQFMDIVAAGTSSPWSNLAFGVLNCTNITGATPSNNYWVGGSGGSSDATDHWASTSGGSAGTGHFPLIQDSGFVDANSGSGTLTKDTGCNVWGSLNFTNTSINTFSWVGGLFVAYFCGDFVLTSGVTFSTSGLADNIFLYGRGSQKIGCGGNTMAIVTGQVTMVAPGGTYTAQDNLSFLNFIITTGTFTATTQNITTGAFSSTGSVTRTINMGSGFWTMTSSSLVWAVSGSSITFNSQTSTIVLTDTSSTAKTFTGSGFTYNNIQFTTGGTGIITLSGANTVNNFTALGGSNLTINFTISQTTTLLGTFFAGSPTGTVTIASTTGGTAYTISRASGIVKTNYLSLKDSTATGGATFYAGANSASVSGNSGWLFSTAPASGSNLAGMGVG